MTTDQPAKRGARRRLLFFVPVAVALLIMFAIVAGREPPPQDEGAERAIHVRTVDAVELPVRASAIAYGTVRAAKSWQGVAQVAGRVVEKHPRLDAGAVLPAGTVLLRIDPADYDVAADRAQADMQGAQSRLQELAATERNLQSSLALARQDLKLAQADVKRRAELAEKGTISQASLDQAERARLQAQQQVRNLENQLRLIPSQRETLRSQMQAAQSQIDQATLQQERTTLTLPFDARIQRVTVEQDQYAAPGQTLVTADLLGTFEVTALIDPARFVALSAHDSFNLNELEARVGETGGAICRQAKVDRMAEARDARSRMIGVIVVVPATDPCAPVPLANNAYVKIKLWSPPRDPQVVVPRIAISQLADSTEVLTLDEEMRLHRTPVEVDFYADNYAVLKSGLAPGATVLVSDIVPVVDGQLTVPHFDETLAQRMREAATDGPPPSQAPIPETQADAGQPADAPAEPDAPESEAPADETNPAPDETMMEGVGG